MKKFLILAITILMSFNSYAQEHLTQAIKGVVVDKETDFPLIGVSVLLVSPEGNALGTTTDIDGKFVLEKVPVGRQTLQFSYIGYRMMTLPNVFVNSAKQVVLQVHLEEDAVALQSVTVVADRRQAINEMAALSARSISMEEITRFSGTMGDVARMAQNYAGVSGATDDRNDIIVRGNSPAGVLYRMEGVDIPAPNHWASLGATGGPISMLNTNNLSTSDFLAGAFPAEYGNATAAVFDLRLRNGNTDKFEFLGQIGFNGFEGGVEGPLSIGHDASFIANYRYSTLGVFQALGLDFGVGSAVPEYQDATFKINVPTKKTGRFSLWGIAGKSHIALKSEPDKNNLFASGDRNIFSGSKTGIIGFSHLYFINDHTSSRVSLVYAATLNETSGEEIREPNTNEFTKIFTQDNFVGKVGINWTLSKKFNTKNRIKTGIVYDNFRIDVVDSILLDNRYWFAETDFVGHTSMYRSFLQWQHRFNEKLTLNTGLHGVIFSLNDSYSIEPRLNLSYEANDRLTFAIGYGRHSQTQPLPIYFSKDPGASPERNDKNLHLGLIKSNHYIVSMDYMVSPKVRLKLEAYYQRLTDLAVHPDYPKFSAINLGASFDFPNYTGFINGGTGKNKGVELTVERFLNKGFYALFTASVFDSKYSGYDKVERNTYYNSKFVFNLLAGREFVFNEKHTLTLDIKINYAGGRRYTPIDIGASIAAGKEVLQADKTYEGQYHPYFRPDFKIGYRKNNRRSSHTFYIDFQNIINHQNEFFQYYNEDEQKVSKIYQRGFFPNVSYQILF